MKHPRCRTLVFAKTPMPGRVKTRLHAVLEPEDCAALHARLVRLTLDKLTRPQLYPVELWCAPDCGDAFFRDCRHDYELELHAQAGDDLGQRMHNALCQSLETCDAAVLVGTDCPSLTRTDIDTACRQLLAGTDVVLGPATDGGYYLVGLRQPHPELFTGISWGRGEVLAQTLARARQQALQVYLLPRRDDLDTPADYRRFLGRDEASADIQGSA
jgi:rSAM/selenodomain-associated transferase 1